MAAKKKAKKATTAQNMRAANRRGNMPAKAQRKAGGARAPANRGNIFNRKRAAPGSASRLTGGGGGGGG